MDKVYLVFCWSEDGEIEKDVIGVADTEEKAKQIIQHSINIFCEGDADGMKYEVLPFEKNVYECDGVKYTV